MTPVMIVPSELSMSYQWIPLKYQTTSESKNCVRNLTVNVYQMQSFLTEMNAKGWGGKKCVCKRQDRRYGDDPGACKGPVTDSQKLSLIRRPGYELKNTGDVAECDQGHFKNKSDYSICIPHTKCPKGYSVIFNGSTTEDRQCQLVTTTVEPLATTVVQLTSTSTMVLSVTSLPTLRRGDQPSKQGDLQKTKNNGTNLGSMEEPKTQIASKVDDISSHQPEDQMTELTGDGQSNIDLAVVLGIFGSLLFIALMVIVMICCWRKKKEKTTDLEQNMIPMLECGNLRNSGTVPATLGETKDPAENNSLLPVYNGSQMDNSSGKDNELSLETDDVGQYTKLQNHPPFPSSEVSKNTSYEEVEGYVLHTKDDIVPNSSEEIQVVEERPKEIGKRILETQQSDQTNVTPKEEPSLPSLRSVGFYSGDQLFLSPTPYTDLQSNSNPPHSLGSLKSEGRYSPFSSTSLDMEYQKRFASQDSDYGSGSSRRNDTDISVSLSSDDRYQKLSVDSLEDSKQLSTDTQSSTKTGKSVAVVSPIRRNEMKTVDEEETCSKSP